MVLAATRRLRTRLCAITRSSARQATCHRTNLGVGSHMNPCGEHWGLQGISIRQLTGGGGEMYAAIGCPCVSSTRSCRHAVCG
eukprot:23763-Eustigmatos_ZCMA.PRE.1